MSDPIITVEKSTSAGYLRMDTSPMPVKTVSVPVPKKPRYIRPAHLRPLIKVVRDPEGMQPQPTAATDHIGNSKVPMEWSSPLRDKWLALVATTCAVNALAFVAWACLYLATL